MWIRAYYGYLPCFYEIEELYQFPGCFSTEWWAWSKYRNVPSVSKVPCTLHLRSSVERSSGREQQAEDGSRVALDVSLRGFGRDLTWPLECAPGRFFESKKRQLSDKLRYLNMIPRRCKWNFFVAIYPYAELHSWLCLATNLQRTSPVSWGDKLPHEIQTWTLSCACMHEPPKRNSKLQRRFLIRTNQCVEKSTSRMNQLIFPFVVLVAAHEGNKSLTKCWFRTFQLRCDDEHRNFHEWVNPKFSSMKKTNIALDLHATMPVELVCFRLASASPTQVSLACADHLSFMPDETDSPPLFPRNWEMEVEDMRWKVRTITRRLVCTEAACALFPQLDDRITA